MRKRAGALIISDKKLLLINEGDQGFFWTPGGGLEGNESFETALKRELHEELGAKTESIELFFQMLDENEKEEVKYFIINKFDKLEVPNDTKILWYSREMYENDSVRISKRVHKHVVPKLISEDFL